MMLLFELVVTHPEPWSAGESGLKVQQSMNQPTNQPSGSQGYLLLSISKPEKNMQNT